MHTHDTKSNRRMTHTHTYAYTTIITHIRRRVHTVETQNTHKDRYTPAQTHSLSLSSSCLSVRSLQKDVDSNESLSNTNTHTTTHTHTHTHTHTPFASAKLTFNTYLCTAFSPGLLIC